MSSIPLQELEGSIDINKYNGGEVVKQLFQVPTNVLVTILKYSKRCILCLIYGVTTTTLSEVVTTH